MFKLNILRWWVLKLPGTGNGIVSYPVLDCSYGGYKPSAAATKMAVYLLKLP
jgi:hypothetical protein